MKQPLGVILAGGQATRMGGSDKGLLPLGSSTLLAQVIARLDPQVAGIALNANGDPARNQGRATIRNKRQGHPFRRQQTNSNAHIDHRLHPKDANQPRARETDEHVALFHQTQQRAHHNHGIKGDNDQDADQPVFLSRNCNNEICMRIRQRPFHLALTDAHAKETTFTDRIRRIAELGIWIEIR
jgi:hypothetical protein